MISPCSRIVIDRERMKDLVGRCNKVLNQFTGWGDHQHGPSFSKNTPLIHRSGTYIMKKVELGVHREEYGEYRMDNAEERKGHQVYEDSTSLG